MMTKLRLMLVRRADVSDAALGKALRAEADRLNRAAPARFSHRRGFKHPDQRLHELTRGAYYAGGPPFDAMMEVVLAPDDLAGAGAALDGFADRLAGLIDPAYCAVIVGASHEILPGTTPIQMVVAARRLPGFSHQGYIDYWFGHHSDEARATDENVSAMGYRQIHCDADAAETIARRGGLALSDFDGMPEVYFADRKTIEAIYLTPGVWEHAFADEQKFVDHSRSMFGLLQMADD